MPVGYHVDCGLSLIVCRFFGHVTGPQIVDMLMQIAPRTTQPGIWRSLILFEADLDMSAIGVADVEPIRAWHRTLYQHPGVERDTGAAVIGTGDAEIILPFYNAMCSASDELQKGFRFFADIPPALDWLGTPRATGLALVERTRDTIAV